MQEVLQQHGVLKVAVINRKGGVGKSTITANLGGELARPRYAADGQLVRRGFNVGLIDTDTQATGALGICLGLHPDDARDNLLYDAMTGRRNIVDGARMIPPEAFRGNLSYDDMGAMVHVGGGKKTVNIPKAVDDPERFGVILDEFARGWGLQIILVDTGPGITLFDGAVYDAMDAFLYITQPETLANLGLRESLEELERRDAWRARRGLKATKVLGIQPNMFGRSNEHGANLRALGEAFGALVWPPIRQLNVFKKMAAYGQIVSVYWPGSAEAEMMLGMTDRFESEVVTWLTTH